MKADQRLTINYQPILKRQSLILFFGLLCCCGCKMIHSVEDSSKAIENNRTAIESSTGVINSNAQAIADSSLVIEKNKVVIEESTVAIGKNAEAIDRFVVALDKLESNKAGVVFIIISMLVLLAAPSVLALLVLRQMKKLADKWAGLKAKG